MIAWVREQQRKEEGTYDAFFTWGAFNSFPYVNPRVPLGGEALGATVGRFRRTVEP